MTLTLLATIPRSRRTRDFDFPILQVSRKAFPPTRFEIIKEGPFAAPGKRPIISGRKSEKFVRPAGPSNEPDGATPSNQFSGRWVQNSVHHSLQETSVATSGCKQGTEFQSTGAGMPRADAARVEGIPLVAAGTKPLVLLAGRPAADRAPDARAGRVWALLLIGLTIQDSGLVIRVSTHAPILWTTSNNWVIRRWHGHHLTS